MKFPVPATFIPVFVITTIFETPFELKVIFELAITLILLLPLAIEFGLNVYHCNVVPVDCKN